MIPLREALAARPDDDFIISAPVRRKSAVRPLPKKIGLGERLISAALAHPRRLAAAVFLTGCAGVIAWNALVQQSARHPAPLFMQRDASPTPLPALSQTLPPMRPAPAQPEAEAPLPLHPQPLVQTPGPAPAPAAPAAKPPSRGAIAELIRNGGSEAGSATAPSVRTAQPPAQTVATAPQAAKAPTMRDPIGEMIRMGGPVPTPPANVGRPEASDLVMSGQRALAKLGYGVKADGFMGTGTRQAIERFERDRRLPVTGEFSARTARELSALSGIPVQ